MGVTNVVAFLQGAQHVADGVRRVLQVVIHQHDEIAPDMVESSHDGVVLTEIAAQ